MARKILALLGAFATVATACNQYNPMMMMNMMGGMGGCGMNMNMMNMMGGCGCGNQYGQHGNGQVWARVCTATGSYNEANIRNAIALHLGVTATTSTVVFGAPATANGQTCVDVTTHGANMAQVPSYCQTVTSALPAGLQSASILSVTCNNNNNGAWNGQYNHNYGGCGCNGYNNGAWNGQHAANGNFMSRVCTAQNNWNTASLRTAIASHFLVANSANNVIFGAPVTTNGQTCADLTVVGSTDATRKAQMCAAPLPAVVSAAGLLSSSCTGNWNGNYNGNCNMNMNMNMGCPQNNMMGMMGGMNPMMMNMMGGMNPMMGGMNPMMMGMNPMMMNMMNPMMMGMMGGMNPMMGMGGMGCP